MDKFTRRLDMRFGIKVKLVIGYATWDDDKRAIFTNSKYKNYIYML